VILAVWTAGLFGTAMWRAKSEVVETRELSREIFAEVGPGSREARAGQVDLEFEKGAMKLDFHRPFAMPAERVSLRSKQGSLNARKLGNASPRTLEIVHKMGGMSVDLRGAWMRDAQVRVV